MKKTDTGQEQKKSTGDHMRNKYIKDELMKQIEPPHAIWHAVRIIKEYSGSIALKTNLKENQLNRKQL